jgi:SAM-dependent methyltransferase
MTTPARYDGIAEWYEREFLASGLVDAPRGLLLRMLGDGPGRLLDVGCGTGFFTAAVVANGWTATGVDVSDDMLRFASDRGLDVVRADGAALPFEDDVFDAVISMWTHTDTDDFGAMVREIARVLKPRGPFVYIGAHPCFVGPHSQFDSAVGVPKLHTGYWRAGRYDDGPGISPDGLRAKAGATHMPLGAFLQCFLSAGFRLEQFEEPERSEYPYMIGLRCRL